MLSKLTQGILIIQLVTAVGCRSAGTSADLDRQDEMLDLVMPRRIQIVQPFSGIASFDGDQIPDGIELALQAVSTLGNPGVMIAGNLRIELFEFVPASANRQGRRLDHWEIPLSTVEQQEQHWNNLTQMYEFRLAIANKPPAPDKKYVVNATYVSPMGRRLSAEIVVTYNAPKTR